MSAAFNCLGSKLIKGSFWCIAILAILAGSSCKKDLEHIEPTVLQSDSDWPAHLYHHTAEWHTYTASYAVSPSPMWPDTYTLDSTWRTIGGDTTINTYTVTDFSGTVGPSTPKVYQRSEVRRRRAYWELTNGNNPSTSGGSVTWSTSVSGFFRQDTLAKRIYSVGYQTIAPYGVLPYEMIVYDYSLELGDTVPRSSWNYYSSTIYTIDSMEQWSIGSTSRKAWHIQPTDRWFVEGIGEVDNRFVYFHSDVLNYDP